MMEWCKSNAVTLAAWFAMGLTLVVTAAGDRAVDQKTVAEHEVHIEKLVQTDERHTASITKIESDLRSVSEAQSRLETLVTRTEATVREMQTLTAELRAMVVVMRTNGDRQ